MLRLYKLFLHLYPPGFRLEFASEMQAVFSQAVSDSARQSGLSVLIFFLHELVYLPRSLLQVHWYELHHKLGKSSMENTPEIIPPATRSSPPEPASWKEALLAGMPALVFPLVYMLPSLVYLFIPDSWKTAFNWLSIIFIFAVLLSGIVWIWKLGWPRWSGGWVAWGWVLLLVPPGLLLQNLNKPRGFSLSEIYLGVVFFTVITLLLYRLMRKGALKGILAALVLMNLFWLPHLEFVPVLRKGVVLLVCWLIIALVSVLIMKLGQVRHAVGLALLATLLVALPFTYAANYLRVFSADAPAGVIAHRADFGDITYHFAPTLVGSLAVLLGPLLAFELWRLSKRSGQAGRVGFRLAFSGLLLSLVGNLTGMWLPTANFWSSSNSPRLNLILYDLNRVAPILVAALTYLGLGLYLVGAFQIVRLSRQKLGVPELWVSALLVLIPALLPMLAMYPAWFGLVSVPSQVPYAFLHLERVRYLAYGLGLTLLVVAGWLVARLNPKELLLQ